MIDRGLIALHRVFRRMRSGARIRRFRTNDGGLWPLYVIEPPPEQVDHGVPVVFFHGFGNDGSTWLPFMSLLGATREVVAPDLPGFGLHSGFSDGDYSPHRYAAACAELLRELTVRWGQPPIVVGKSMGAMIAGLVAAEIPKLVRALVLIDPAGIRSPRVSEFWQTWSGGRNLLLPAGPEDWEPMIDILYRRRPHIPGFARRQALRELLRSRDHLSAVFNGLLSEGFDPLGSALAKLSCPLTLIWGAGDRVMDPSGVERVREACPGVEVHLIPGCGHSPTREHPAEVRRVLLRVVSRYG